MRRENFSQFIKFIAIALLVVFLILQIVSSQQLGINEANLKTITGLFGLLGTISSVLPAAIQGLSNVFKPTNTIEADQPILSRTRLDDLETAFLLHDGLPAKWIDRGLSSTGILRKTMRVIIVGGPKSGKSREAFELIQRMVHEKHVSGDNIFVAENNFWRSDAARMKDAILRVPDARKQAIILIDGILSVNVGDAFKRIETMLDVLKPYRNVFVILTAQRDEYGGNRLAGHDVQKILLPDFEPPQTRQLVNNAAKLMGLKLDASARTVLIDRGGGNPGLVLLAMQSLRHKAAARSKFTADDVTFALTDEWKVARGSIQKNVKDSDFLLEALDSFQVAHLKPELELVIKYAGSLRRDKLGLGLLFAKAPKISSVLTAMSDYAITVSDGLIQCNPLLLENPANSQAVQHRLEAFLRNDARKQTVQDRLQSILQGLYNAAIGSLQLFLWPLVLAIAGGFSVLGALFVYGDKIAPYTYTSILWMGAVVFCLSGILRGWAREILVSMGLIFALFLINLAGNFEIARRYFDGPDPIRNFLAHCFVLILTTSVFYFSIFTMQRLLSASIRERMSDSLYGGGLGFLNGYLLLGSMLYYVWANDPIPNLATIPPAVVAYLPPSLLGVPGIYFAVVLAIIFVLVVYV